MQPFRLTALRAVEKVYKLAESCGLERITEGFSSSFAHYEWKLRISGYDLFYLETDGTPTILDLADSVLDMLAAALQNTTCPVLCPRAIGASLRRAWRDELGGQLVGYACSPEEALTVYHVVHAVSQRMGIAPPTMVVEPKYYVDGSPSGLYKVWFYA